MVSYRFLGSGNTASSPDQQLLNEVGYLSNLDDEQLPQFLDIVFEFLLVQKAEELISSLKDLVNFRLSEEQATLFAQQYKTNLIGLSRSFVGNTLTINQVLDMQWRFGVTTASSESKKGGNTFLQLKLVLDKGGDSKEDVHMELTLPQFYQFLREMEQAKQSLEYFN
eukprot:gene7889-9260_t